MPKQKDLKRIVRSRMLKTGESYTTARRQTIAKKPSPSLPDTASEPPPPPPAPEAYAALAGMSDDAVRLQSGRSWSEWVETLDAFGGLEKPHHDVAAHVHALGVPDWWAQTVTVGYERIRGLRQKGQRRSGAWEASKSKTFAVGVDRLFEACADEQLRGRWLGDVPLTIRTATRPRSMRMAWDDGSSVELWFTAKGDAKSAVAVQHTKLASQDDAQARKAYWSERLEALAQVVGA